MIRHLAKLVALAGPLLLATAPPSAQFRDYEGEARALGLGLQVYLEQAARDEVLIHGKISSDLDGFKEGVRIGIRYGNEREARIHHATASPYDRGYTAGVRSKPPTSQPAGPPAAENRELRWERAAVLGK